MRSRRRRLHKVVIETGGLIATVIFASFLAGCSTEVRELPITYVPQQNVRAIKGADAIAVEVTVEDLQPDEYESPWQARFHVKDAAETVKGAAETELKARGFKIGRGGALVTIQLDRFAGEGETDGTFALTATARSYISMRVQVRPQTGKALFSRSVGAEPDPLSGTPWKLGRHPVTHELQESLAEVFNGLFSDPAFTAAILATRQAAPAKPVSPARIAGAYAIMSRR